MNLLTVVGAVVLVLVGSPLVQSAESLTNTPKTVVLDYRAKEMVINTTLRAPGANRPSKVWVWAFFLNPSEGVSGSRSDSPVEVPVNWRGRDTVTVTARGGFHWATNVDVPKRGFFAKVYVSPLSADAVQVRTAKRDKSLTGALAVTSKQ